MELFLYFLIPLGLTILIEGIIAFICGLRTVRELSVVVLTQILTNPIVNYALLIIYQKMNAYYYGLYLFVIEIMVLFVETFIYKNCLLTQKISPLRLSILCNLTSFGIGIIWGLLDVSI